MNKKIEIEIIKKFVVKNKQERIIWELSSEKRRQNVIWHFDHPSFFKKDILYPTTYMDSKKMEKKLYEMSGSKECYYIGETYI